MWIEIVGIGGMILLLLNFYLASSQRLNDHRYPYHVLNFFGAIGVMINAWSKQVWSVAFVEVAWAIIALVGVVHVFRMTRRAS